MAIALADALVVKFFGAEASDADLAATIGRWQRRHAARFADVHAHRGARSADVYVYFELATAAPWSTADRQSLGAALVADAPKQDKGMVVDRLECVLDVPGASIGARRVLHYVVETDAADGWLDELERWYNTEHMPGLAAVPGCIRARRFINHDHGPHSYACYDLARVGVTESLPWLAVRATPWSDRVRPQFRNTRRTMFSELEPPVST